MSSAPLTAANAAAAIGPLLRAFQGLQRADDLLALLAGLDQEIGERQKRIADLDGAELVRRAAHDADRARIADEEQAAHGRVAEAKASAEADVQKQRDALATEIAKARSDLAGVQAAIDAAHKARSDAEASVKTAQDEAWQKVRVAQEDQARTLKALQGQIDAKKAELDAVTAKHEDAKSALAGLVAKLGA
jgi:chromosome segregation ATPase